MNQDAVDNTNILFVLIRDHKWKKFKKILETAITQYDINVRDNYGNYLLTYAVRYNQKKIVKLLLDSGARCDIIDRHDRCILYDPIDANYVDIIKLILDKSAASVGVNVVDIKDDNGNIPLHYAIKNNNVELTQLLLKYKSNPNTKDNSGYNALHIASKNQSVNDSNDTNSVKIAALLLTYMTNLDAKTDNGETALHLALNYGNNSICLLLLNNGANSDVVESKNELSPLHYAVGLNNITMVHHIVQKANINVQDIYGNTPLMYAIKENYYECFRILIEQPNIDVNKWNIHGKQALHEVFGIKDADRENYIDRLIAMSDVSFQDANGNTGLHFLAFDNLWTKYTKILETKKLNIFVKNSDGLYVVDIVSKYGDLSLFVDMVVKSYLFLLKQGANWQDNIDYLCSKALSDLTSEEKTQLKAKLSGIQAENTSSNNDLSSACATIIKEKLMKTISAIRDKKPLEHQSFPTKLSESISIDTDNLLEICTFIGTHLDILIGLLFLVKKHKHACAPISTRINKKTLCEIYTSAGLPVTNKCEFINFEMLWIGGYNLFALDNFSTTFNKCKNRAHFIIIPLGIEMQNGAHSNYLIYDKETNEIERFEPHGSSAPIGYNYNPTLLDETLSNYFKNIDEQITYIAPSEYMPRIAFQIMDEQEIKKRKIGDPGGFCALWSIWYVDQRLTNHNIDNKTLVLSLIETIKNNQISFKNMIRNYSRYITTYRDSLLSKINLTINDWINDNYTTEQLDIFNSILIKEIQKLNW